MFIRHTSNYIFPLLPYYNTLDNHYYMQLRTVAAAVGTVRDRRLILHLRWLWLYWTFHARLADVTLPLLPAQWYGHNLPAGSAGIMQLLPWRQWPSFRPIADDSVWFPWLDAGAIRAIELWTGFFTAFCQNTDFIFLRAEIVAGSCLFDNWCTFKV